MDGVRVKEGESIESALKRFKKVTEVKRKKKALAAKKRAVKKLRKAW
jgi:small subunit ribosomal protein S21